jgi:hypothetical protein
MVHAGSNGEIMSKSNDVSTLDHRPLADSELDAVSGGTVGEFIDGVATGILGPSLADKLAVAAANALGRVLGGRW